MKKLFSFSILIIHILSGHSQEVKIGTWKDYLSYKTGLSVSIANNKIYCATTSSVFTYDISDNSIERLSKINGLSDIEIAKMAYDEKSNTTLIAYKNANIDLIKNGKIINIADIERYNVAGIKSINQIFFKNDYAYLACSFGIVVVNIKKEEIKDTYYIGTNGSKININEITILNDSIYAATNTGILKANANSINLTNYNEWKLIENLPEINNKYLYLVNHANNLYTSVVKSINGTVSNINFKYNGSSWSIIDTTTSTLFGINTSNNKLIFSYDRFFYVYDSEGNKIFTSPKYEGWEDPRPSRVEIDKNQNYWVADRNSGLVRMDKTGYIERISPNGPASNDLWHFKVKEGNLWMATGGHTIQWGNTWKRIGLYYYKDYKWDYMNELNSNRFDSIMDIIHINVNPNNNNQVYACSYWGGLMEITDNKITNIYNSFNSSLKAFQNQTDYAVKVSSSAFDKDGNLWVANNTGTSTLLSVKKPDGIWKEFDFNSISNTIVGEIIITNNSYKWLILPRSGGILVFDDNNTIDNINDDRYIKLGFSESSGNIPGSDVLSIKEDKNGYVWIGTDEGVAVFYNPSSVFDGASAQQIKIIQDGNVQLLFETEAITAIEIDGANRKWIGTEKGGVFLVSDDGTNMIHSFNTTNSSLLSNTILHIDVDESNGEVFFGTDKGLISYKSTATEGRDNYKDIYVYPNPVRGNYDGLIAIKGLIENSDIRITDISGNLIYKTQSLGGQAIWDGKDFSGQRAKTGIYLVYVSDQNGNKTTMTKLLFLDK